ncbi:MULTISPECIES: hypothetical protein [Streptomycetaceae]|nr:hypothetical protein [Streptomyces sp. CB02056]
MFTSARSRGPVRRTTTGLTTAPVAPLPFRPLPQAFPAAVGSGFSWG